MAVDKPLIAVAPYQFILSHVLDIGTSRRQARNARGHPFPSPDLRLCETHWPRTTCACTHYRLEWHGERASTEGFDFEMGRWL